MRIISGNLKGFNVIAPKGNDVTRPTSEKVREAVFGSIQFEIENAMVLDLFGGSGAFGIEAISREAKKVVFVDKSRMAVQAIKQNLKSANVVDRAEVLHMDFRDALKSIKDRFDFVFIDPPYSAGLYEEAIDTVLNTDILEEDGVVIVEHESNMNLEKYNVYKQKRYGRTYISYIRK